MRGSACIPDLEEHFVNIRRVNFGDFESSQTPAAPPHRSEVGVLLMENKRRNFRGAALFSTCVLHVFENACRSRALFPTAIEADPPSVTRAASIPKRDQVSLRNNSKAIETFFRVTKTHRVRHAVQSRISDGAPSTPVELHEDSG